MSEQAKKKPAEELDLQPRLRVKRVNRLAVLLVAAVGIAVLWAAYFALSNRPSIAPTVEQPSTPSPRERAALERLRRAAEPKPEPPPKKPFVQPAPSFSATPRPPVRSPEEIQARQRLARAYDAGVLVDAFGGRRRGGRGGGFDLEAEARRTRELADALATATVDGRAVDGSGHEPAALGARARSHDEADRREDFLRRAAGKGSSPYLEAAVRAPLSPYELRAGTTLPAILTTGIHSDLPGQTTALVRRDVYDSTTGRHLLIPAGSRLLGEYDHRVAWGQKRVLLAWNRLVFPDGRSLDLRGMPGADLAGMAGLRDRVDNHFVRVFGSALLLSAISAGAQLSQPQEAADGGAPSARQVAAAALGQELGRTATEITRRNLDVRPSLIIRPGYLFHVELTADLVLPGPWRPGR